ncbi:MAG: hypothetical protein HC898_00140 [Phycisphaerales bacterium]|nr:hypothetical protein [Phycisphaerales bacterium]
MFNYIKRLFGRGKQDVALLEYREARKLLASSGGQQVLVFLNPIIWHLGAREKQKGAPLTETEVYSIRDQAKCMVMSHDEANFFYSQMDAQSPVPRINPENIWVEWQKIRTKIDRYMPT